VKTSRKRERKRKGKRKRKKERKGKEKEKKLKYRTNNNKNTTKIQKKCRELPQIANQTINLLSNKFLIQYICTIAVPRITNNSTPVSINISA